MLSISGILFILVHAKGVIKRLWQKKDKLMKKKFASYLWGEEADLRGQHVDVLGGLGPGNLKMYFTKVISIENIELLQTHGHSIKKKSTHRGQKAMNTIYILSRIHWIRKEEVGIFF